MPHDAADLTPPDAVTDGRHPSRRALLRLGAAATVGAAASIAASHSGEAAAGVTLGSNANTASNPTGTSKIGTTGGGLTVTGGGLGLGSAAICGTTGGPFVIGVAGYGEADGTTGVIGSSESPGGLSSTGVSGTAPASESGANPGIGVVASGTRAALLLVSTGAALVPSRRAPDGYDANTIDVSFGTGDENALWHCVDDRPTRVWRRLSGTGTAGAFTPIDPVRVYDSRLPAPTPGILGGGASRLVSVADARDPLTGAVTTANAVPVGATAVAFNITVTATTGSGFLAVAPGDATGSPASSVNWSASGQTFANGLIGKIHTDRTVRVFSGGPGTTHVVLDINGYWR